MPKLAEAGGSSGHPAGGANMVPIRTCPEAQDKRYVSPCRHGCSWLPCFLTLWLCSGLPLFQLGWSPSLTEKLDEMTRNGQSHEVPWLELQIVTSIGWLWPCDLALYPDSFAWKENMSPVMSYEGRTRLAAVDVNPLLPYKRTIDYTECVMKKSLSCAVIVTDRNMIEFG